MSQKIIGMFTGLIMGYLLGLILGFTFFNPEQDVWALLGFVLALVGLGVGLTPFFQRISAVVLLALIGFYLGTLGGILLWGNITEDDLLEVLRTRNLVLPIAGIVIGGFVGTRLPAEHIRSILFAFVFGGFLGGYVLGVALQLAPFPALVGWSPFVIGSGLLAASLLKLNQHRNSSGSR